MHVLLQFSNFLAILSNNFDFPFHDEKHLSCQLPLSENKFSLRYYPPLQLLGDSCSKSRVIFWKHIRISHKIVENEVFDINPEIGRQIENDIFLFNSSLMLPFKVKELDNPLPYGSLDIIKLHPFIHSITSAKRKEINIRPSII